MTWTLKIIQRGIATSSVCNGKRNFRKFLLYNKRGPREFKERQRTNPDPDIPIDKRGVRDVGWKEHGEFVIIPEMIPELVVPNLKDFKLKPYVSYRSTKVVQNKFTAKDLFNVVYSEKIIKDFNDKKLTENGEPLEPNEFEKLSPPEAKERAAKTGSDMF